MKRPVWPGPRSDRVLILLFIESQTSPASHLIKDVPLKSSRSDNVLLFRLKRLLQSRIMSSMIG